MEPPYRAPLAPARPCPYPEKEKRGALYAKASGMVWQSKIWGLEFAGKSFIPTNSAPLSTLITVDEKIFIPDFAWRPGFKIDLGYQLPYDGWDLNSRWTYYHSYFTSLKKHLDLQTAPPGMGIVPLWVYPFYRTIIPTSGDPIRYRSSRANWALTFNSADLELGRYFFISHSLPLRLALGAKVVWIRQHYHADYNSGTTIQIELIRQASPRSLRLVSSRFAYGQRSWGLGPRTSFDSRWPLGLGFSLIGNGAFSLLYSSFQTTTEFNDLSIALSDLLNPTTDVFTPSLHRKETFHLLAPVLEAQFGFDWGVCFGKMKPYTFDMLIAYEWQYWWAQNHVRRNYSPFSSGTTFDARGDLQMHGLTTTFRLDF